MAFSVTEIPTEENQRGKLLQPGIYTIQQGLGEL